MARKRRSDPLSEGLSSARPTPKRIEVIEEPVEVVTIVDDAMVRKSLKGIIFSVIFFLFYKFAVVIWILYMLFYNVCITIGLNILHLVILL